MVELGDTQRMGLLIGAAAILIFVVVNMAGLLGGGDEKLFIIDLIGIGSMDAMRPDTGFSTQDIVGLLVAAAWVHCTSCLRRKNSTGRHS